MEGKVRNMYSVARMLVLAGTMGAASAVFAQQSSNPGLVQRLSELLSSSAEDELLEPERAFSVVLQAAGPDRLVAELKPAPGYYLYKERIRFALKDAPGVTIHSVDLPKGTVRKDPTFGTTETYASPIQAVVRLQRPDGPRRITVSASYQGCHEKTGVCYPPMSKDIVLGLP